MKNVIWKPEQNPDLTEKESDLDQSEMLGGQAKAGDFFVLSFPRKSDPIIIGCATHIHRSKDKCL